LKRPLHIVYVVQYFNLPSEPGGGRAYHFATHWARAGHRVTVVTGTVNHKTAEVPEKYRGRLFTHETLEGVTLIRCASSSSIRRSIGGRIRNFLGFALLASWAAMFRTGRPDIFYASSTPLTVGLPGLLGSLRWRRPFVFEVRDLWPESAVIAGILRNRWVIRAATAFERLLYRRARRIVAVTRGIEAGIVGYGVPREKVVFVPNGVDDLVGEAAPPVPARGDGKFRVVYVGALGRWNGNETLVEAAGLLRDDAGIEFVVVGDGDQRPQLEEQARAAGARMRFLGALPKDRAVEEIRAGDACVICTWDHPFHKMVLANKIFDYLGAGKPVLAAARGEMEQLLAEAEAGLVVEPGDPVALAGIVRKMRDLPEAERAAMGRRGREHVLAHYRRSELAGRVEGVLEELVAPGPNR
jgi:glycosyltransferase involved in cell wall biosynthesis